MIATFLDSCFHRNDRPYYTIIYLYSFCYGILRNTVQLANISAANTSSAVNVHGPKCSANCVY